MLGMRKRSRFPIWAVVIIGGLWLSVAVLDAVLIHNLVSSVTKSFDKALISAAVFLVFAVWITYDKIACGGTHHRVWHKVAFSVMVLIATAFLAFMALRDQVADTYRLTERVLNAALKPSAPSSPNDWVLFSYLLTDAPRGLKVAFGGLVTFFCLIAWMSEEMLRGSAGSDDDDDPFDGRGIS
jgi:hypothetical protein